MNNDAAILLNSKDYDSLCTNYGIYKFQAQMLSFMFITSKVLSLKNNIINGITSGRYSRNDSVRDMFKLFIDKAVKHSKDNGFSILVNKCGLSEIDANTFIYEYLRNSKNTDEMLSAELDVSNNNIRMNEMIDEIFPAFLESEKSHTL